MEEVRTEMEFDELERLLREIPKATLVNSHSEELTSKTLSLQGSLLPIHINSCKEASNEMLHKKDVLDESNLLVDIAHRSRIKKAKPVEPNLPDDQSLATAIAELHFSDGFAETTLRTTANYKPLQDHAATLNHQCPSEIKKQPPNIDPKGNIVGSLRAPNNVSYGCEEAEVTKIRHQSVDLLRLDAQETKKMQGEHFSAAFPVSHGAQGFRFVSGGVPLQNLDFHAMPNQLPCFVNGRSHFPYAYSHQLSQPHINWTVEEERYYRMHQQYISMQQLHNQGFEAQYIHANGSPPARAIGQIPRQPYLDLPAASETEQCNLEPFSNKFVTSAAFNQSGRALSSASVNSLHYQDKIAVQSFHEKLHTRSNALNKIKDLKFGSGVGKESFPNVNQNGRAGYFHRSFSFENSACLQQDDLNSWVLPSDIETTNLRSIPRRYNSVDDVSGRIYLMAKDQHGCRFLQQKFSEGTTEDIKKIFIEIIDHIVELMTDPFGNYLVQKLLEVCDDCQRLQILHAITENAGDLVRISCDMHGTRAVQKVIETLKTPEQFAMVVSSLQLGIVTVIKNMNGNHVAQRCLQCLTPEYRKFLFEAATTNCVELATDRHGCCVLQKCLIHSEGEQQRNLVSGITSNAVILSQDPFGNYVVQFVFELQLPWATADILNQLQGKYGDLSMLKYSSNVVEKCLKYADEEQCSRIIWELINNARLEQVMQDPYGNYVIQAALKQSKGAVHAALVGAIRPLVPLLRMSPYGKKVLSNNGLKK